jgi:hypothetical protein
MLSALGDLEYMCIGTLKKKNVVLEGQDKSISQSCNSVILEILRMPTARTDADDR